MPLVHPDPLPPEVAPISVGFTYNRDLYGQGWSAEVLLTTEAEKRGLRFRGADGWPCDKARGALRANTAGIKLCSLDFNNELCEVLDLSGDLVLISATDERVWIEYAASDGNRTGELLEWLRAQFVRPVIVEEVPRIPVRFWHQSGNGPRSVRRWLDVSTWEAVAPNYAKDTRGHLENLASLPEERRQNGLVLWHGSPGTGKTHALRALAWSWRDWASFNYIVDPDVFLGGSPDYLFHLISEFAQDDDVDGWSVLVLEDTGELLAADARARVGQALSRLLNLSDGLLGQELRLITVVTTNEPLASIHPAVARPGRCLAEAEFMTFSQSEARSWLRSKGHEDAGPRVGMGGCSLAELYALADGTLERADQHLMSEVSYL